MSVRPASAPIHTVRFRNGHSTARVRRGGSGEPTSTLVWLRLGLLFAIAAAATITISSADPLWHWSLEGAALLLATWHFATSRAVAPKLPALILLAGISLWGFGQLAFGATENAHATLDATVRFASYGAVALLAADLLGDPRARQFWLRWASWFTAIVAVVSVLAYHTSPQKILWLVPSPYPDNWGPFPSRNNFAQFLELAFPVSLYRLGQTRGSDEDRLWLEALVPAVIFAAALASASRAGAVLVVLEALALSILLGSRSRKILGIFALLATGLVLLAGAGTLLNRFADPDPLSMRREIFHSAAKMAAARPWSGFGLGTFREVYPEYAEFDPGAMVDHAHNDWLEWASEGGVGFAAVWLGLAVLLVPRAARSIWGMGVAALFLHALVDYPFARLGVAVWFFALSGALVARERGLSGESEPSGRRILSGSRGETFSL